MLQGSFQSSKRENDFRVNLATESRSSGDKAKHRESSQVCSEDD